MTAKKLLALSGFIVGLFAISPSVSYATSHLNCVAYGQIAVKQAKENLARKCGFTGSLWSLNQAGHTHWCMSPNRQMAELTGGDRARANALAQCKQKKAGNSDKRIKCKAYANAMTGYAKKNRKLKCGFTDARFDDNRTGHFNWCFAQGNMNQANGHRQAAGQMITQCRKKAKTRDNFYAAKKVKDCNKLAKKAQEYRGLVNKECSQGVWPAPLKQDFDRCMKDGTSKALLANNTLFGKYSGCLAEKGKAKLAQTKRFPDSGKSGTRRKKPLPVDVCLREFNRDNSWFLGFGGGVTDPPFGHQCGKSVATAFCITKGYVEAIEAPTKTYDAGKDMDGRFASTYWIGSKKACHGKCAGFQYIICKGKL